MDTKSVEHIRELARGAAEGIAQDRRVAGCAVVVFTRPSVDIVLIEHSKHAKVLVQTYASSGLLMRDPVMRSALVTPGVLKWKIPTSREKSTIWCDSADSIIKTHKAAGSHAGFWLSWFEHNVGVASCVFGVSDDVHDPELLMSAEDRVTNVGRAISKVLYRSFTENVQHSAFQLTARQKLVAKLLAQGHTQAAVAVKLNISARTVAFHLQEIRQRMGGCSTTEALVRIALDLGNDLSEGVSQLSDG